jgi:hypothetical protein
MTKVFLRRIRFHKAEIVPRNVKAQRAPANRREGEIRLFFA